MVVVAADNDNNKLFAFTCTLDHAVIAEVLDVPNPNWVHPSIAVPAGTTPQTV